MELFKNWVALAFVIGTITFIANEVYGHLVSWGLNTGGAVVLSLLLSLLAIAFLIASVFQISDF